MRELRCYHCGGQMFETGRVTEHYDGTCDVEFGCDCGHSEIWVLESDEPPIANYGSSLTWRSRDCWR